MGLLTTNQEGTGDGPGFCTTHWTVLADAGKDDPQSAAALQQLCQAYWFPLYAFIRRRGYAPEEAEDLTQSFFVYVLENQLLARVNRKRGKFRSYLLAVLKNFLANDWHRQQAQKRGGGKTSFSIDDTAKLRCRAELVDNTTPETVYEIQWALTLLERVLQRLRTEHSGKLPLFEQVQDCLPGFHRDAFYVEKATSLGMSAAAVRQAVSRMRHRYGKLLRAEIAATVSSPEEIDEELQHLIAVLARQRNNI